MSVSATATADIRASLGPQFLLAAAFFAREAKRLEQLGAGANEDAKSQHLAYVVGAVMQAVSALETEIGEIVRHGPGCHLGSNGTDQQGQEFLKQFVDFVDPLPILVKYDVVVRLLKKSPYDPGASFLAEAKLVIELRNELVHFKSKWGTEMEPPGKKPEPLIKRMQARRHRAAPWAPAAGANNFFPHRCLSAECAAWATQTAIAFIDEFYDRIGVPKRMDAFRSKLAT